jgi:hypothetical protein
MTIIFLRRFWPFVFAYALLLLKFAPAEAAHCRHGQIYRVSMHRCVGATSRLGREVRPYRRYAKLEEHETRRSRHAKPKDWYLDVQIPEKAPEDRPPESAKVEEPVVEINPRWPEKWWSWHLPYRLTGP